MADLRARAKATAAVGRFIGTADGRELLRDNGYVSDQMIIVALPDESIGDVMSRVTRHHPPVVIAVWYGEDSKEPLQFATVQPGSPQASTSPDQFGASATIGMLLQLMANEARHGLTFRLTDWTGYEARSFAPSGLAMA